MFELNKIVRENIRSLTPYSSARDEYQGKQGIFLDANENANGSPLSRNYNRYPDPMQRQAKEKISRLKNIPGENIFLGNGSDEAIDIVFRVFCRPGIDNVIICPPTYGMYEVSANINDVEVRKVPLRSASFQLDPDGIYNTADANTKIIFICSPNNPTGNVMKEDVISDLLANFPGIVVLDEAYADFSSTSFLNSLKKYPNLIILQTFSKAWGMAGLRVGMAFASKEIIDFFNRVKSPYNVNSVSQELLCEALGNSEKVEKWIAEIRQERLRLTDELSKLPFVERIYPSQANFILVKTADAGGLYRSLIAHQIIVRDRSKVELCEGCLRITIGTKSENKKLIEELKKYRNEKSIIY
ncbi:MAG: histidinol-phosphate transaminase [Bacteroidia bacterium]